MGANNRYFAGGMFVVCMTILLYGAGVAHAGAAGTTGGQLLELMPNARAGGMGDTFCAIADDANCMFYNPAGLGALRWTEVPFSSDQLSEGVNYQFLGFAYSLRDVHTANVADLGTFAAGYSELTSGNIDRRDIAGVRSGTYNVKDTLWTLSYGKVLLDGEESGTLMAGAGVKLLSEEIAGYSAANTLFDGGILWRLPGSGVSLGASALNMGGKLSYSQESFDAPTVIKGGIGYTASGGDLVIGGDVNSPSSGDMYYSVGGEYYFLRALALRAGYNSRSDLGNGVSFGFGVNLRQVDLFFWLFAREISIDYAYIPMGDLGSTQRISIILKIGAE